MVSGAVHTRLSEVEARSVKVKSTKPLSSLSQFHSTRPVAGLTHGFYRYPATTSPELVREVVLAHSSEGDYVLDPFMGGGTTIVEALAGGRRGIGSDLNSLATFITRVKTTPLTAAEWDGVWSWIEDRPLEPGVELQPPGSLSTLPASLRVPMRRALARVKRLPSPRQQALVRCALLRMGQWALESSFVYPRRIDDRRNVTPTIGMLDAKLREVLTEMQLGMEQLVSSAREHGIRKWELPGRRLIMKSAAEDLFPRERLAPLRGKVRLVMTSPPYPGVHVLYHRWQITARRETSAPYAIAGSPDGMALSYYTMGGRHARGLERYFERLERAFRTIRPLLARDALVVQLVAFNRSREQLPKYLSAMEKAGYKTDRSGPLLVREVPHRRWYSRGRDFDASREYLLFHSRG